MSHQPIRVDWGKLILLVLIVAGIITLLAIDEVQWNQAGPVIGAVVGYLTGNGRLTLQGRYSAPAIAPERRHRPTGDTGD